MSIAPTINRNNHNPDVTQTTINRYRESNQNLINDSLNKNGNLIFNNKAIQPVKATFSFASPINTKVDIRNNDNIHKPPMQNGDKQRLFKAYHNLNQLSFGGTELNDQSNRFH